MYRLIILLIVLISPSISNAEYFVYNGICYAFQKIVTNGDVWSWTYDTSYLDGDTLRYAPSRTNTLRTGAFYTKFYRYGTSVQEPNVYAWHLSTTQNGWRRHSGSGEDYASRISTSHPSEIHPAGCVECNTETHEWVNTPTGWQCQELCNQEGYVRNSNGECVYCPSGNFTLQNVCIPYCQHGTGQPVGSLYPHDTGVCVPPPCTEDETSVSAEPLLGNKCIPNCHLDRYNPETGLCTEPCKSDEYSLSDDGECFDIPDCGPLQQWSSNQKECVDKPACGTNMVRNPDTGDCECDSGSVEDPNDQTKCVKVKTEEENKPDDDSHKEPVEGNSNPGIITTNPDMPNEGQGTANQPHNPDGDNDGNPDETNPDGEGNTDGTKTGYWGTGEKPVITNADHKWGVDKRQVDFKPLYDMSIEIKKTDIYKGINNLKTIVDKMVISGSAPVFHFEIGGYPLNIDLSVMAPAVEIIRHLLSVLIWFCLIFVILKQWRWL